MRDELAAHEARVARDLAPADVEALRAADADLGEREAQVRQRREQIVDERRAQEQILQSFPQDALKPPPRPPRDRSGGLSPK